VASHIPACREDHSPGERGLPSIEFPVDEISQADEPETDRKPGAHKVRDLPEIPSAFPAQKQCCEYDANKSSVERHSPLPDVEDFNRPLKVAAQIVKKDITDPATDHYPEN